MHSNIIAPLSAAPSADDLLADTNAAQYLGVATQTMRNWRWRGTGPRWVRIGKRLVRYRRCDLEAFIARGASEAEGAK